MIEKTLDWCDFITPYPLFIILLNHLTVMQADIFNSFIIETCI
jgi:hypothetical protein